MDSRHGPIAEDAVIMQQVADIQNAPESRASFQYVIVLTKADKNVKSAKSSSTSTTANRGRVSAKVMDAVRSTLQQAGLANSRVPILLSSAETKLGRDDLWRYLRRAAEA
jgi:GTP-binding protein EngB required for normal cell division